MSESFGRGRTLVGHERDEYLDCLTAEAVPSRQRPFYVMRVNHFIRAAGGRDPTSLDAREIGDVLASLGRRETLPDRQFAQLVDAVRIYVAGHLKSRAAGGVDWAYWKGSARSLKTDHASTARESRPEELLRRKVRQGTEALAEVRRRHEGLIVRFVTEIRASGPRSAAGPPSGSAAIPSGTVSPRIFWKPLTTSAPCRSCSGTRTWRRP